MKKNLYRYSLRYCSFGWFVLESSCFGCSIIKSAVRAACSACGSGCCSVVTPFLSCISQCWTDLCGLQNDVGGLGSSESVTVRTIINGSNKRKAPLPDC